MTTRNLAFMAILLWCGTAALFGWFFVKGNTTRGEDGRTVVMLAPGERNLVLMEMRNLLQGTQEVLDGIDRQDRKQIIRSARNMGTAAAADVNPALMAKLPLTFKQLGMSVHRDMDELAAAAESGRGVQDLQGMLVSTLSKCVACHSAWQLSGGNP